MRWLGRGGRLAGGNLREAGGWLLGEDPYGGPLAGRPLTGRTFSGKTLAGKNLTGRTLTGRTRGGGGGGNPVI